MELFFAKFQLKNCVTLVIEVTTTLH